MFKRRISNQNYYSNRGNERQSRRALSGKLRTIKNLAIKICAVFLFGGIIYLVFCTQILTVKNINIEGNKVINSGEIEEIIISLAGEKKWKIFNNNILLISAVDMESAIKGRFGNINSVKIEKKFPRTIKVVINEKPADISWCNKIRIEKIANEKNASSDEVLASEIPQCYLSDEEGIIYEKIGDSAIGNSIRVFRDESIEIGNKISDENLKNFIRKIFYDFNDKTGLSLNYLYLLPPESRELHLSTSEKWKIYFDLNRGADEQIGDLNEFIKKGLAEDDKRNIDYIDLRVVDRVYYKVKDEIKANAN